MRSFPQGRRSLGPALVLLTQIFQLDSFLTHHPASAVPGFIFSIGIITGFGERLPATADVGALLVALFWIFAIGPVVLFGLVLYPSRSLAPHLETEADSVRHTYYFRPTVTLGLNGFVQDLKACDWLKEIGYEIMKQSSLRELKRHRFLRALWAAGVTYLVAATIQILRSMEAFPLR